MIRRKTKIGEEINTIKIFKNTKPQQSKEVVSPKNKQSLQTFSYTSQEKNEIKTVNKSKKKRNHHNHYHKKYHLGIIMNNYVPTRKPRRNV